ncbi:MAG: AI-2E family transporter [Halobacteriales archaeon]
MSGVGILEDRTEALLIVLSGTLLVFTVLLVLPFLQFFLLAVLLAYPLQPIQRRLASLTTPLVSAATLVTVAVLVIVVPSLFVLRRIVLEASNLIERIRTGEIDIPSVVTDIENRLNREFDVTIDVQDTLQTAAEQANVSAVDSLLGLFETVSHVLIGLGLTVFLLYYLLKDGRKFDRWLHATVPLPERVQQELHDAFEDVMSAVLVSHVFIAVVQGIIAGIGLVVVGIPNPFLWTTVMIVLAIVPIIGSFVVWGPAVVYLVSLDQFLAGAFLFVYGAVVVGLTDDYLRPIVIDRYTQTQLNPAIILVGVLGGVFVFGVMGIFFGPIVVGASKATLDVYRKEYVENSVEPTSD